MGAFTLLVSGIITGAVGPWLPYQMFTAGWAGLTAGWVAAAMHRLHRFDAGPATRRSLRLDVAVLCVFGFAWGLLYGVIINIWFWPFAAGPVDQTWSPGTGLVDTLARYATFYTVTSLAWDMVRAVGNAALILLLGAAMVKALTRFRQRFDFQVKVTDV